MLLGSVSVCKAPISIFTSLSFKERKVTGLSYVELSSLLNFPSRTTWRKNTFISVSTSDHTSMALVSKVNIHSTHCYWQLVTVLPSQTRHRSSRAKHNTEHNPHITQIPLQNHQENKNGNAKQSTSDFMVPKWWGRGNRDSKMLIEALLSSVGFT